MGSGKRRTSRFRKKSKRTGKYAQYASKAVLYNGITSQVYPPLPAKMHLALRSSHAGILSITAGNRYLIDSQDLDQPLLNFDDGISKWGGGFHSLFYLYSKAVVKKVILHTRVQCYGSDSLAQQTNFTTDFVTAVVPISQTNFYTTVAAFDKLKAMPDAHTHGLGAPQGGHDVVHDYRTIDIEKYIGQPLTNREALIKTDYNAGTNTATITIPSINESNPLPSLILGFLLPAAVPTGATYRYDVNIDATFCVEFSDMRDLPTTPAMTNVTFATVRR